MSSLLVFNRVNRLENGDTVRHVGIFDPALWPIGFSIITFLWEIKKLKKSHIYVHRELEQKNIAHLKKDSTGRAQKSFRGYCGTFSLAAHSNKYLSIEKEYTFWKFQGVSAWDIVCTCFSTEASLDGVGLPGKDFLLFPPVLCLYKIYGFDIQRLTDVLK